MKFTKRVLAIGILTSCPLLVNANYFSENVNLVSRDSTYTDDYDSSKFRMKIYKSSPRKIVKTLRRNPLDLCETAKSDQNFAGRTSAHYVLSILKAALSIDPSDKDFTLDNPTYFWERYLTYRNFVDISFSFSKIDAFELFKRLPEGIIILAEKSCFEDEKGAVALLCPPENLFSKDFPDFKKLQSKLNDPKFPKCKIGKGLKLIVEAQRFREINQSSEGLN